MRTWTMLVCAALVVAACSKDEEKAPDGSIETDGPTGLVWYTTCGDPICRTDDAGAPPAGIPRCVTEKEGMACRGRDSVCDPGLGCGVQLRCTDRDPKTQPGGCPISRLAKKTDLRYLDDEDLARLEAEVRALRLARYRYRDAPARERLGFVIEDAPGSPAVDGPRDLIDLYAYTSVVAGALKRQMLRLDAQERELARLRERCERR